MPLGQTATRRSQRWSAGRSMSNRFGPVSQALHWVLALLILAELALGHTMLGAESKELRRALVSLHKPIGLLILSLVLVRIAWRVRVGLPEWPAGLTSRHTRVLRTLEGLLYLLMVGMPLSGLTMNMAAGWTIPLFGLLEIPSLLPESEIWHERLEIVHGVGAKTFLAAILVHLAIVLYYDRRLSKGFLTRMLPMRGHGAKRR